MVTHELDVVVTRGDAVESTHRVHAAVVDSHDRLIGKAYNPELVTWWRSCAKPFQAIPLIESGGFDAVRWGDDALALTCASHGGEPEHIEIVEGMLGSLNLEEGDLACGPHEPLSARGAKILRDRDERFTRIHNNCSGKHTGMLAFAMHNGWSIAGYEQHSHPVQQAMLNQVALWTGTLPSQVGIAIDGCGVSVFGLPLDRMARAYARFGAAVQRGEEVPSRIAAAIGNNPLLLAGTDRIDSLIVEETHGRVIAKIGAEGVHSAVVLDSGIGIALKVEDGDIRAQQPALIRLLQELDALPDPLPARLAELLVRPVRNTRGEVVGETRMKSAMRKRSGAVSAAAN